jgi:ubiquinone biosynthesis UbiH/UbiF/VisC/COQ6 family hydroxylase
MGRDGYNPGVKSSTESVSMTALSTPASPASARSSGSVHLHDVAVVGGGLVGAAFALGCAQAGLDTLLIAGSRASSSTGSIVPTQETWDRRVYAISPATRRFLDALKIWSQLNPERLAPVRDMRVFGAAPPAGAVQAAEAALHFSAHQAGTDALAWIVEHRELARVLNVALGFQPRLTRIDADATSMSVAPDQAVLETVRGPARAQLLVGADGAHSRVREALRLSSTCKPYEQTGVVANFACTKPHGGVAHQWFIDGGVVALLPLPQTTSQNAVSLVWSAPNALAQVLLQAPPEALAQRLEALTGGASGVLGTLTPLSGISGFPLELLGTARQIDTRSALIGDAAHVVHPLAGQGLNLGLQDAEVLCTLLRERESFRDCGDAVLLRRYERARKAPVWAMRQATDGLQRLFASDDRLVKTARGLGMNLIDRLPVIKKVLIRQAMG